jgi:hypothetical protein
MTKTQLNGIVLMDDTFFRKSYKGIKNVNNYQDTKTLRGVSNNLICYTTAVDENKNVISLYSGIGKNTNAKMGNKFEGRVAENSLIVSDLDNIFAKFATRQNLDIFQMKASTFKEHKSEHDLGLINSLHSEFKGMIKRTRHVSMKWLDCYIQFVS